jgi:hypothetical protein
MAAFEPDAPQRRDRATHRRRQPHTYFVGRRPYEAAEVYAVTEHDVRRLHRDRPLGLDWRDHRDGLELSRVLLARVAGMTPRREVAEEFALSILAGLPDDGFVLDSDEIWRWLQSLSRPYGVVRAEPRRESWRARLLAACRRTGAR